MTYSNIREAKAASENDIMKLVYQIWRAVTIEGKPPSYCKPLLLKIGNIWKKEGQTAWKEALNEYGNYELAAEAAMMEQGYPPPRFNKWAICQHCGFVLLPYGADLSDPAPFILSCEWCKTDLFNNQENKNERN